jgi:predicted nucleotide-binding protein
MSEHTEWHIGEVGNFANGPNSSAGNRHTHYHQSEPTSPDPETIAQPDRPSPDVPLTRRVFVVHGRDDEARSAVFGLLRALGLQPWEWGQMVADLGQTAPFNGQVVAHGLLKAQATVVLLTPDDVAYLHPDLHHGQEPEHERRRTGQPRPNVLIELGMALMAAEARTIIVEFGRLRPVADLAGRNVVRFDGSRAAVDKLAARLRTAGCQVDTQGVDWTSLARFSELSVYQRRPVPAVDEEA